MHLNRAKVLVVAATLVHHIEAKMVEVKLTSVENRWTSIGARARYTQHPAPLTSNPHIKVLISYETGSLRRICKGLKTSDDLKKTEVLIAATVSTKRLYWEIYKGLNKQL